MTKLDTSTFDRLAVPYDRGMAPLERLLLREMRTRLLPYARGRVLEVGVGTGANLPFYHRSVCLTAVDESTDMLSVAGQRADALGRCTYLSQVDVEHLAFPSGFFDTVVGSLVLCSVVDQDRTLGELRRVLRKPAGQLLLLEHMRPEAQPLAWLVDVADIPWHALQGRCHLNRRTHQAITHAGFHLVHTETRAGGIFRLVVARAS